MSKALLSLLLPALASATIFCPAFDSIVAILNEGSEVTDFCNSALGTVTTTFTQTSTPSAITSTTSISSTNTVTTTSVSTVSGTTTVYPIVAVTTTSTCGAAAINKRDEPTPLALLGYAPSDVASGCACLSVAPETVAVAITINLPTATVTSTVASTAETTVTEYSTTTTFTATYSGTQYYTNTYTILPPPSSTIVASLAPAETFGAYALDFNGYDIESFNCYPNGPPLPAKYSGTECNNFEDCVNECAYYNTQQFGASSNTTCGAALYNSPGDGSSGYCYLKTQVHRCGSSNKNTNTGVVLPLVAST